MITSKPVPVDLTIRRESLDLAFIMDTTGSMSSYIETARRNIQRVVDEVSTDSNKDIKFALVEYRDHPPQDHTYVFRKHDFTPLVSTMKSWLDASQASGGGDTPEAVADALHAGNSLSWRPNAVKIAVLVADAPPHGLDPPLDRSFPGGSPNGHDPIDMAHKFAKLGVKLYSVGCEPSISPYKDFFMAMAYIAGGQYIPLTDPQKLIDAIIGGAREEMSLSKFSQDVQNEVQKVIASGAQPNKDAITQSVFKRLSDSGAQTTQLLRNNQPLEGPSAGALAIAATTSLADARNVFTKGSSAGSTGGTLTRKLSPIGGRISAFDKMASRPSMRIADAPILHSATGGGVGGEAFTAVERSISMDQVARMVNMAVAAAV
ncbi:uncharacterized protein LOC127876528 [Dreissena polymorpha]|nr:uncharacterized protein LOC127876528 [Dreissena polymorpha]